MRSRAAAHSAHCTSDFDRCGGTRVIICRYCLICPVEIDRAKSTWRLPRTETRLASPASASGAPYRACPPSKAVITASLDLHAVGGTTLRGSCLGDRASVLCLVQIPLRCRQSSLLADVDRLAAVIHGYPTSRTTCHPTLVSTSPTSSLDSYQTNPGSRAASQEGEGCESRYPRRRRASLTCRYQIS